MIMYGQIIFLLVGIGVKTNEFKKSVLFWRLTLFVHLFIYAYHPCIGMVVTHSLSAWTNISLFLLDGLMITLCLPTTISGAVVLTANSNGNEAAAVVNTSMSNLLGIALTPALILAFLGNLGDIDIAAVFIKLALRVILPVCSLLIHQNKS